MQKRSAWAADRCRDSDSTVSANRLFGVSTENRFGSFFSTGAAGECTGSRQLGEGGCTWKMRSVVRVLAYEQMAEAGWDRTDDPGLAGANANLAAFKKAWSQLDAFVKPSPLKSFKTDDADADAGNQQTVAADELSLWPMPASAKLLGPACLEISSAAEFALTSASSSAILRRALSRYKNLTFLAGGAKQPCSQGAAAAGSAALTGLSVVIESDDETLGPGTAENYTLITSAPTAVLTAGSVFGAIRGLESFAQLTFSGAVPGGGGAGAKRLLPSVSIQDSPRFGFRAISVDTARMVRPLHNRSVAHLFLLAAFCSDLYRSYLRLSLCLNHFR